MKESFDVHGICQSMLLPHVVKVHMAQQQMVNAGKVVCQSSTTCFRRETDQENGGLRQQCNMVGNEELLNEVCYVQFCIVLLKLGRRKALNVKNNNRLQNFRDVAVAVNCTSNVYEEGAEVKYNGTYNTITLGQGSV